MKLFYKYDYPILPFGHEHDFCSSSMSGAFPFPYYFWWPPVLRLSVCPLLCLSHVSHPKEGRMHVCSSIFGIFRCVFWWLCDSMVWTSCFCGLLCIYVCWCFPVLFPGLIDGFAVVFVMDCFFSLSIVWLYFSSLNSHMAIKGCTKFKVASKRCPIVFQGHPSNFKVTGLKNRFWPKLGISGL